MSSLRNFVVIVLLAGVLGVVYFAINKGPKAAERSELAPPWATTQDNTPQTVTSPAGSGGLPGFPPGSALPGTSIASSPPAVTLPPAPQQPGISTTVAVPASPFPSLAPPAQMTPAPVASTPPADPANAGTGEVALHLLARRVEDTLGRLIDHISLADLHEQAVRAQGEARSMFYI